MTAAISGTVKSGQGDHRDCPNGACQDSQIYSGDPINTRTGAFDYSVGLLSIGTLAGPLVLELAYSSAAIQTFTTTLGYGWTHNHDTRLIFPGDPGGEAGFVIFKAHGVGRYRFVDNLDGTFTPYASVLASLVENGDGSYTVVNSSQATYDFEDDGRLLAWSDPNGNTFTYTYSGGLLSRVADPSGQRYLDFAYDPGVAGRLTTVTDHSSRQVSLAYDGSTGDLTGITDAGSQTWTYAYSGGTHLLTEALDPDSQTLVRTEYDGQGRAWRQYDGRDELVLELTYNADGTTTATDALGHTTSYAHDPRNTYVSGSNAQSGETDKNYDTNFRPTTVTDERGHATNLRWNSSGANLTVLVDAALNRTDLGYDSFNNLTATIDPRQYLTTYEYNGTLLTASTDALNATTLYSYTAEGLLEAMTDPLGRTTTYTYDGFGQLQTMTDEENRTTAYTYDAVGRLESVTGPDGRANWTCYDAAGRVRRTVANASGDGATPQTDPCDAANYVPSGNSELTG